MKIWAGEIKKATIFCRNANTLAQVIKVIEIDGVGKVLYVNWISNTIDVEAPTDYLNYLQKDWA